MVLLQLDSTWQMQPMAFVVRAAFASAKRSEHKAIVASAMLMIQCMAF